MAELFGVNTQAITRHLGNIYEEGELVKTATCSKMEQVRKEGSRTVSRKLDFYNLDAIISVGPRWTSHRHPDMRLTILTSARIIKAHCFFDCAAVWLKHVVALQQQKSFEL